VAASCWIMATRRTGTYSVTVRHATANARYVSGSPVIVSAVSCQDRSAVWARISGDSAIAPTRSGAAGPRTTMSTETASAGNCSDHARPTRIVAATWTRATVASVHARAGGRSFRRPNATCRRCRAIVAAVAIEAY